ncbi:MAG: HD domain-containing protein, partial [Candidatus Limnocylindria bacterium]
MDLARLRAAPAAVVQRVSRRQAAAEPTPTIEDVVEEARQHRPSINVGLIERAHDVAAQAHDGQVRASGESYISHPVAVAHYLATLQMDAETLAGALLHDVPEDTELTLADIEKRFGREVTRLVDGVTKLSKFGSARSMEEQQAEN